MNFNKSVTNGGHHPVSPQRAYPHSYLEASMARTFYPKYVNYTGDGTGRDAYVILNNGGLANADKKGMMFRKFGSPNSVTPHPLKESKAFTYISDGTGRDSYVIQNSGGLVHDFRCQPAESLFKGSLRRLERSNLPPRNKRFNGSPEITDFLNWITPRD